MNADAATGDAKADQGHRRAVTVVGRRWADELRPLLAEAEPRFSGGTRAAWFQLGKMQLQIACAEGAREFIDQFAARYGDCSLGRAPEGGGHLRCEVTRLAGSPLLCFTFVAAEVPDPLEAAGTPFRITHSHARYAEVPGPLPGWRMVIDPEAGAALMAGDRRRLVVDTETAPEEFASDCVVSVVQAAQRDVLFLHAASFGIAGRGAILVGWSQSGKSTTALAVAARGHAFLGDDIAAIDSKTGELLPFPRAVNLRPGAYVQSLEARLRAKRHATAVGDDGQIRTVVSMGEVFPTSRSTALPLRFAFLLDGFADRPRLTPYAPEIADAKRLRPVVNGRTPFWGLSPGRDLIRFLAIVDVLSKLDCYLLELGPSEQSVAAIEAVMEGACN